MSDEEVDYDETGSGEYDSGPFCRHWGDPSDCDEPCVCGHPCRQHGSESCNADGCECQGFEDAA